MTQAQSVFADAPAVGPRQLVQRLHAARGEPRFSICTLVTKPDQYRDCLDSYRRGGFDEGSSEVLILDNTNGNTADAYVAINEFLQVAQGEYIILTHQDILLMEDGRPDLEERLAELTRFDPHWALCGNAGHTSADKPVQHLSHPVSDHDVRGGPFPAAVVSLDENFIVARRSANLALSRDLTGFHHYGADLCIIADVLGWNAYVIAFMLRHQSGGTVDASYLESGKAITGKYARALRPRWINLVTERPVYISGSRVATLRARTVRWFRDRFRHARAIGGAWRRRLTDNDGR